MENNESFIDKAIIHDDLVLYMMDTLNWIPSKNPGKEGNPTSHGINYWGVTLFDKQSSESLLGIFNSWRDLFKNAIPTFELTGNFVEGDDDQEGHYEKLKLNRDEVLKQLDKMISLVERLAGGDFYLYHCGI
ncbi:hypothetical protein [Filibacter tadaridae]